MFEYLFKIVSVFALSMIKFIGGPLSAAYMGLHFWEAVVFTILGMMFSVYTFTYFGIQIRSWYYLRMGNKRKIFSLKSRKLVTLWKSYGLQGVAFLTPILLSPIGGSLMAVSFGANRRKILGYMFVSALFWGVVLNIFTYYLKSFFTSDH